MTLNTPDHRRRVLIVDDSFIMRRLVKEIVESDPDLTVCGSAENGKVALAMVRSQKPDVILLDIEMPEMSGLETLRRLGLRSPSKVVILSSLVAEEDAAERIEALRLGAFAAVGKPSGAVSLDLKQHRASEIVAVVRRATNLPALAPEPAVPAEDIVRAEDPYAGALMELLDAGVLGFDAVGRLTTFNPSAARLVQPTRLTAGMPIDDIFCDFNAVIAEQIRERMRGNARSQAEIDMCDAEGTWIPLRLTVGPLRGAKGGTGVLVALEDISHEKRMKALLDRTLSSSVADQMIDASEAGVSGQAREVTILFADLRNFTRLSEALGAAGVVELLNEYFSFMADIIRAKGGVIDKYIGDAVMALFGAPLSHGDDADRAVEAARDMMRALELFNEGRVQSGQMPIQIGIGLATGPVIAGAIGSPDRLNFTVIGDAVNLASRLEGQTKSYGVPILACSTTVGRLTRPASVRRIDIVQVKGQDTPTELHEVRPDNMDAAGAKHFSAAFDHYLAGSFSLAAAAFSRVAALDARDSASRLLQARCEALAADPPQDWAGVWRLTEK
jgi:PAS domain S-box-containing protein